MNIAHRMTPRLLLLSAVVSISPCPALCADSKSKPVTFDLEGKKRDDSIVSRMPPGPAGTLSEYEAGLKAGRFQAAKVMTVGPMNKGLNLKDQKN